MQRSIDRILTTLVGSLPRPIDLRKMWDAKLTGQGHDEATFLSRIKSSSAEMVQRLADTGIDVVSDGEQGRLGWTNYLSERLDGLRTGLLPQEVPRPIAESGHPAPSQGILQRWQDCGLWEGDGNSYPNHCRTLTLKWSVWAR